MSSSSSAWNHNRVLCLNLVKRRMRRKRASEQDNGPTDEFLLEWAIQTLGEVELLRRFAIEKLTLYKSWPHRLRSGQGLPAHARAGLLGDFNRARISEGERPSIHRCEFLEFVAMVSQYRWMRMAVLAFAGSPEERRRAETALEHAARIKKLETEG